MTGPRSLDSAAHVRAVNCATVNGSKAGGGPGFVDATKDD
jgi:hypothetical protein